MEKREWEPNFVDFLKYERPCRYPITITGIPSQLFAFAYLAVCPESMSPRFSEVWKSET
jgi:hypothetical protein